MSDPGSITVTKVVDNTGGGSAMPSDFGFTLRPDPDPAPVHGEIFPTGGTATFRNLPPGTYSVIETTSLPNYEETSNTCSDLTVVPNADLSCTIINTFVSDPGSISVTKTVTGGSAMPSDFGFTLRPDPAPVRGEIFPTGGTATFRNLPPDTYSVSETTSPPNYEETSNTCSDLIIIASGEHAVCAITNTFLPTPTLTVISVVVNDGGGPLDLSDFPLFIDDNPTSSGRAVSVNSGDHVVSETGHDDYDTVISGDCDTLGGVNVPPGGRSACTITYTFRVEQPDTSLHLSISSGSDSATLPGPSATISGGPAQLRIEERNEGGVALYRVLVTLEGRNSGLLRELSHADLAEGEGKRDDDHILEPDEIWVWLVDVDLTEEEWYEAKSEATNIGGDWHLHEIDPNRPSVLRPDQGQQTALHVTVTQVLRRTITIVKTVTSNVSGISDEEVANDEFTFKIVRLPGEEIIEEFRLTSRESPHTTVLLPPGIYRIVESFPEERAVGDWARDTENDARICGAPTDVEGLTVTITLADANVTCWFENRLVDPNLDSRAALTLLVKQGDLYVDEAQVEEGSEVDLLVTFENLGQVNLADIKVTISGVDITLTWDRLRPDEDPKMWPVPGVLVVETTTLVATATATAIGAENPELVPASVLLTIGGDGCFCGDGILGVFCLLLIAFIGGVIAITLTYVVKQITGPEEKPEDNEDKDTKHTVVVNTNSSAKEIHLESCRYVAEMSDEHRQEITCTAAELIALGAGDPPAQIKEWLDRDGYDGCAHCLPQYQVN